MATPWEAASATVASVADALAGKVVVSVANALVRQGREMHALVPARGSVAAMVATAAPRALVAAAGHHLPAASLADLDVALEGDVLVCSDHAEATSATMALFDAVPRLRALDAGSLSSAAAVEAFTAVLVSLNIRYRAHSTLRLAGLDHVERAEGRRR
jgi:NADPH-dependent F420 reductase